MALFSHEDGTNCWTMTLTPEEQEQYNVNEDTLRHGGFDVQGIVKIVTEGISKEMAEEGFEGILGVSIGWVNPDQLEITVEETDYDDEDEDEEESPFEGLDRVCDCRFADEIESIEDKETRTSLRADALEYIDELQAFLETQKARLLEGQQNESRAIGNMWCYKFTTLDKVIEGCCMFLQQNQKDDWGFEDKKLNKVMLDFQDKVKVDVEITVHNEETETEETENAETETTESTTMDEKVAEAVATVCTESEKDTGIDIKGISEIMDSASETDKEKIKRAFTDIVFLNATLQEAACTKLKDEYYLYGDHSYCNMYILGEYGEETPITTARVAYMHEHGTRIVERDAITTLARLG